MSAPAAAIDIGSNSVHLLVARPGADGAPATLLDVSHQAGVGLHVDATGELGSMLRWSVVTTLVDYVAQARAAGAMDVVIVGTEAMRRAGDATLLAEELKDETGLTATVLDRVTEGLLTMLGVTGGRIPGSLAVVDIGGGSTQVTVAHPDGPPVVGLLPAGSARLAARHVHSDPIIDEEVASLRLAARELVAGLDVPYVERAIVAGGSGTNVPRLLGRERTTPVDRATIRDSLTLLREHPAADLAERTGLTPRRVAQLAAGLAIGEALLDHLGLDVAEVSDASLRDGLLIATWDAGADWLRALPGIIASRSSRDAADRAADARDGAS
ncbi:MAG: hypothetical protein U0667_02510 [Chloroflexota bacterium]